MAQLKKRHRAQTASAPPMSPRRASNTDALSLFYGQWVCFNHQFGREKKWTMLQVIMFEIASGIFYFTVFFFSTHHGSNLETLVFLQRRSLFRLNWLRFLLQHQTGQTEKPGGICGFLVVNTKIIAKQQLRFRWVWDAVDNDFWPALAEAAAD